MISTSNFVKQFNIVFFIMYNYLALPIHNNTGDMYVKIEYKYNNN